jgi:hypothetical protein
MGKRKSPEEIADLVQLPIHEYQRKYNEPNRNKVTTLKRYYLKQLAKRSQHMDTEPQPTTEVQQNHERIDKIAQLLERSGISLDEVEKVNRVNVYQGYLKTPEGDFQVQDLYSVQYTPKENDEERTYISQADPTIIRPTKIKARANKEKSAIILPDMQAPYEDPKALDVAYQIIRDTQPDEVIMNGDNLDLDLFSRFVGEGGIESLNDSINRVHKIMAQIRANAPNAKITWLEGNHELRLRKMLMTNARDLLGVRQAGTNSNVLSIPFLLNLAELEIDYVSGYPANQYWVHPSLRIIHGHIVRSSGNTAAAVAKSSDVSTIFGHVHRREHYSRVVNSYNIGKVITAASFGCLAKVSGEVPSYHNGVTEDGEPVQYFESWQHGLGLVTWQGESHDIQQINIDTFNDYRTRYGGKIYLPNDSAK